MKENATYTPRGLTQNWSTLQQQGSNKKVSRTGSFMSKNDRDRRIFARTLPINSVVVEKPVDNSTFTIKVNAEGERIVTRVNGKFVKGQSYSESLAKKLGI